MTPATPTLDELKSRPMDDAWAIEHFLGEQRRMTAIEKFSQVHDEHAIPDQERYYRDLIPLSTPGTGEQYAFEVDLDACSGCKACVAACHSLNGLDETESWRDVGLLLGGTEESPVMQNVTSACHHCASPGCMDGCPVKAYEKDPITGIVRHLDDQCIGCQYCILKCPYDIPKYNKAKGIVRKCDMCSSRLAVGEAPACVQSCPNQAIKITVVKKADIVMAAENNQFLPGAPDPGYTQPSTRFVSKKGLPANMVAGDQEESRPQDAHWPLGIMLVLTQMSVGAFAVEQALRFALGNHALEALRPVHAIISLSTGLLALGASTLHLGRPLYAFRAILGLKTSWMSREILAFGIFAGLASAYAFHVLFMPDNARIEGWLGASVALSGLLGVFCSAMIYHDTRRVFWDITLTGPKFGMSSLLLGIPVVLVTMLFASGLHEELDPSAAMRGWGRILCGTLIVVTFTKLLFESAAFSHLKDLRTSPLRRSAALMAGELFGATRRRFALGIAGGLLCPALLLLVPDAGEPLLWALAGLMLTFSLAGELHERYLFFTAVVSPKMPGGVL